jgi:hypothetical protein
MSTHGVADLRVQRRERERCILASRHHEEGRGVFLSGPSRAFGRPLGDDHDDTERFLLVASAVIRRGQEAGVRIGVFRCRAGTRSAYVRGNSLRDDHDPCCHFSYRLYASRGRYADTST